MNFATYKQVYDSIRISKRITDNTGGGIQSDQPNIAQSDQNPYDYTTSDTADKARRDRWDILNFRQVVQSYRDAYRLIQALTYPSINLEDNLDNSSNYFLNAIKTNETTTAFITDYGENIVPVSLSANVPSSLVKKVITSSVNSTLTLSETDLTIKLPISPNQVWTFVNPNFFRSFIKKVGWSFTLYSSLAFSATLTLLVKEYSDEQGFLSLLTKSYNLISSSFDFGSIVLDLSQDCDYFTYSYTITGVSGSLDVFLSRSIVSQSLLYLSTPILSHLESQIATFLYNSNFNIETKTLENSYNEQIITTSTDSLKSYRTGEMIKYGKSILPPHILTQLDNLSLTKNYLFYE